MSEEINFDEIEYWLANVEVLDNTDYILNNRKAKILVRYLKEKQQENERLNNIINKAIEYIKTVPVDFSYRDRVEYIEEAITEYNDKLLDILKGEDKE